MIELNSLSCKYDNELILKNTSLKIENHLSILGANGSGKSTLARSICNLIPYEGEITLDSIDVKELSLKQKAKIISYIPAKAELFDPYITLCEFVLLGRFAYKKSFFDYSEKDKKITQDTLEFLNIEHLSSHTLSSLSSGEQQLALIAQALTQQSRTIIFDEPTANLDPHNSKIIARYIKGLKEHHRIILITHDLHLANYIDSPVAFIKDKKLKLFKDSFFDDENLMSLYGVEFESMAVKYD